MNADKNMEVYPRSSAFIGGQFCFSVDSATFELPALQNRHRCPNLSNLFFHLVFELRPHQCLRPHSEQNRLGFAKVPLALRKQPEKLPCPIRIVHDLFLQRLRRFELLLGAQAMEELDSNSFRSFPLERFQQKCFDR